MIYTEQKPDQNTGKEFIFGICGFPSADISDFETDETHHAGYRGPCCDGFTTWGGDRSRTYRVLFETDAKAETTEARRLFPVWVPPLRYPGGKSLLTPGIFKHLNPGHTRTFVEPHAGGASAGLSLLLSGNVKKLCLNETDYGVYSLFRAIRHDPVRLANRIGAFHPSETAFKNAQEAVKAAMDLAEHGVRVSDLTEKSRKTGLILDDAANKISFKPAAELSKEEKQSFFAEAEGKYQPYIILRPKPFVAKRGIFEKSSFFHH